MLCILPVHNCNFCLFKTRDNQNILGHQNKPPCEDTQVRASPYQFKKVLKVSEKECKRLSLYATSDKLLLLP